MEKFGPLNLAKKPIKNKRFFYLTIGILITCNLFFFSLNSYNIIKFINKSKEVSFNISKMKTRISQLQNSKKLYLGKIRRFELKYGEEVKTLNNLIFKKVFSWSSLLSKLENSLPNNVIIFSIRPDLKKNELKLKLEIGARTTESFLFFMDSLRKNGFQNIKVDRERLGNDGLILVSITLTYPLEV